MKFEQISHEHVPICAYCKGTLANDGVFHRCKSGFQCVDRLNYRIVTPNMLK